MICRAVHRAAGFSVTLKCRTFRRECAGIGAPRSQEYQALPVFGKDSRLVLLKSLDRSGRNAGPIRSCDADEIRGDSPLRDDIGGLRALDAGSLHLRPCF